jgi:hypothetical protein
MGRERWNGGWDGKVTTTKGDAERLENVIPWGMMKPPRAMTFVPWLSPPRAASTVRFSTGVLARKPASSAGTSQDQLRQVPSICLCAYIDSAGRIHCPDDSVQHAESLLFENFVHRPEF